MTSIVRSVHVAILGLACLASFTASAAEIDPKLIAAAQKEGRLVYYTDLIIEQVVRPLVAAFEKKYGIKVSFTRGDSQVNSVKVLNEFRAGRVQSDVFGLTSGFHVLVDAGAVRPFTTANGDELPAHYRDPNRYWVATHVYVMTPGINTSLVPAAQRPRPMTTCSHRTGATRWCGSRTTCPAPRASSATC